MTKATTKKRLLKEQPTIEPEVVGKVSEGDKESFHDNEFAGTILMPMETFSVKLDNKRLDNRTAEQAHAIVLGAIGSVKKIVIEKD